MCNASYKKTNKSTDVKITYLHTIYRNSDMFRSVLIIFRELIYISKAYMITFSTLKFVHKIFVDIVKFFGEFFVIVKR
jgi:hypothetical protein